MKRTGIIYTFVGILVGLGIIGILHLGSQLSGPVATASEVAATPVSEPVASHGGSSLWD